jgi:4-hydroxybenzoate polyprenyltransferase
MFDFRFLLKVSRPRFWFYIFGPYLIGLVAAFANRSDLLSAKALIFGIFFIFPANLLIYGINDIFDYETDKLNQKKQEYELLVSPKQHKNLLFYILLFNLPFIIASFIFAVEALPALAGFLFFSIFYSAPPIRAKTKPFLDSSFNILYVFPGVFAYQMISGANPPLLIFIAAGIWTFAMHAYSAIPDIEADREANIKTAATQLGANYTLLLCLCFYLISAFLVYKFLGTLSFVMAFIYTSMILISFRLKQTNRMFSVYKFFPLINAVAGFLLFWFIAFAKFF